jgi:DNA-binding GntR family transcriptional regulator
VEIAMSPQAKTRSEEIFHRLYELILTGDIALGSELNEVALSQRFAVSRGPVREAIQRLQGLRLVTRERHMRARVLELSQNDLIEIFQLREAAEGMACRLATQVMSDAAIADLLSGLERSRGNSNGQKHLDIHETIARNCGNKRIEALLCEDLYHLLRIYRYRSGVTLGRRKPAFDEHWQICRALRSRDGELAESLMRAHIGRATSTLLAHIDQPGRIETPAGDPDTTIFGGHEIEPR